MAKRGGGRARSSWPFFRRVLGRLAGALFVCWGVVTMVFFLGVVSGQDPALARLGVFADQAARTAFAEESGLNDPILVRYVRYLGQVAQGDLGVSVVTGESVSSLLGRALPVTASLALMAILLATTGALVLGCVAALASGSILDRTILVFASVGQSVPTFWLGLMAIQFLAVTHRLIPSGGYTPVSEGVGGWLHSIITPAIVLSIPLMAAVARLVRTSVLEELGRDYVRTARGLGLPPHIVIGVNVLRNALVAPMTVLGLYLGGMFAGTVLVESVFRLPGIGSLTVTGVSQGDFGIVQAAAMCAAFAFVVANVLVDAFQTWANPRTRTDEP